MPLTRLPHWQTRTYNAFLEARAGEPFAWGVNDCALFAADGILSITGTDICPALRKRYTDARGALAALRDLGGSNDMAVSIPVIAERCGLTRRANPLMAGRGDLVLVDDGGRLICALVGLSARWVHAPGETGLRNLCITAVQHCWTY